MKHHINYTNKIASKILQRRYQILVHSCLYYDFDDNIVDDAQWNTWAHELAELQNKYPEIAEQVQYADDFKGFTGDSGHDLYYREPHIVATAKWLRHYDYQKRR